MRTGIAAVVALWLGGQAALAANGMTMIGENARASGLGGAGVALAEDCPGCNPATLGGGDGTYLSVGVAFLHPPVGVRNEASLPDEVVSDEHVYSVPWFEAARRLGGGRWTVGLSVRAQGGLGVDFTEARTPFGTVDGFDTDFRFGRAMPTVAYRTAGGMRLGAALVVSFAEMSSSLFPDTYSPGFDGVPGTADDFAGMKLAGASGVGYAARLGIQKQLGDRLSLGFVYTSETGLDLDGGELTLDLGFAKVRYEAEIPGFAWPQEAEAGFAWNASPEWLVAGDLRWIDWSATVGTLALRGSNPDIPVPLERPEAEFQVRWDDQWVVALGAERRLSARDTVRFGYNYAASPAPDAYVSPLFPGIVEHHATLGYSRRGGRWLLHVAFEHSFAHAQVNGNPDPAVNPFGPGARVVAHPGNVLHFGATWQL